MTTAWLCQIDAWDGADAAVVRVASHDDDRLCHLNGVSWWPAIARLPVFRYDFFDGSFGGGITEPSGQFEIMLDGLPDLPALALHDARLRWWRGALGDGFDDFDLTFDGRITTQPEFADGRGTVEFAVDGRWLDDPLLPTYAGTGDAEGPLDLQGTVKPLLLGAPRFVTGVLVDAVTQIYQLSGCGAIQAVDLAFDRLSRFGASVGDATDYAVLEAMDLAAGTWATCVSLGLVRMGAPPDGLLTFHVRGDNVGGWHRLPGAIIARIAAIKGASDRLAAGTADALDIARPWELSIAVTEQTTPRELIQRIAASVNAVATISWLGKLVLSAVEIGAPALTLAADGSALPPVAKVRQVAVSAPWWRLATQANRTWQVHALSDIAFREGTLTPRGQYNPATVYRAGDWVNLLDGSEWLFIGATPTAGSAPADGNPNWERKSDALVPVDSTGAALEAIVAEAKETADRKSATFFQDTAPSAADSDVNDIWVNTADGNRSYRRVPGSGRLSIGSDAITLGGDHIILAWTFCDDQRIGQAILDAAGALGVADGKASRFTMFRSNEPEPVGDGIGDLLTRAYLSPPQIDHWNGSDWIPASTYGATAQQSADIAAVVSDGVLSKGEKPAVVLEYNRVNSEYTAQAAQAIALGVGASERTIAATKLSALNSYMAGLSPAYTDTSADTVIVAATYQAKWNDVYVANANLAAIVSGTIGAPSGTPVGTITADDVSGTIKSGGGVGTNQVDTPALQPNSATLLAFAVDASAHTLAAGATDDGLPLSYTSIGASVRVDFRVQVGRSAGSATTGNTIFVRRTGAGDTTLKAMGIPFSSASGGETDYWTVDTPPAGAVTYLMKFSRDSGSGSVLYSDQQITILEAKR